MHRYWIVPAAVLVSLVLGASAHAQDKDKDKKLVWKFEEKKPFIQKLETNTKQELTVSGMANTQDQKQTFWFVWNLKEKKEGKLVIEQTIVGLAMDITIGGNTITFKSWEKNPDNPMTNFFNKLVDHKFTLTVDPKTMEVSKVEGVDKLVTDLSAVNAAMKPLLKEILSEKAVKEMARPILGVTPEGGDIPKDGSWKAKPSVLDMGPIGTYETTTTYKVDDKDKDKNPVPIKVTSKLKYTAPMKAQAQQLPFTIKSADLKSEKAEGTIYFDRKLGRIQKSDMDVKLTGKLTVEIAGQSTVVDLNQTQAVAMATYEPGSEELLKAAPWAKDKSWAKKAK
jgi:hypothetical protein